MIKRVKNTAARSLAKFSVLVLLGIVGLGTYLAWMWWVPTTPKGATKVSVSIPHGSSAYEVGEILQTAQLIRSPRLFQLYIRLNKIELQAGEYVLTSGNMADLARALTKGRASETKITIPEGYRIEQIAEVAGLPIQEFRIAAQRFEGQLFPDTYYVEKDLTSEELVEIMNENFLKKVKDTDTRILILASLIERETRNKEEKPIVAGIIEKRLEAGWPLELDATIQYWLGKPGDWWPQTTLADRKIKSPYNTYLNPGLPPNPICNPGLDSILAAKNPVESPYWFYLHEPDGTIHYAKTAEEHNENIDKYIRGR